MSRTVFLYIGGALPIVWGMAHLFPTRGVVAGFGDISLDNRRIITMEWLTEGVVLIVLGTIVCVTAGLDPDSATARAVYWIVIVGLNTLSVVSAFTGARIRFLPFRLCPVIFTGSSLFILVALR